MKMAIEIVDLLIDSMVLSHSDVEGYQRVVATIGELGLLLH